MIRPLPLLFLLLACGRGEVDRDAYFPPTVIDSSARVLKWNALCLPEYPADSSARLVVTAAGVGLPIPSSFVEDPLSYERGVPFENRRAWTRPPDAGTVYYRVTPAAELRSVHAIDSIYDYAYDVRSCDATIDGRRAHLVTFSIPPGYLRGGAGEEVHLWFAAGDGRMVSLVAQGPLGFREIVLPILRSVRIGLPPSHAEFPHGPAPVASTLSPDSVPPEDTIAYRGNLTLGGGFGGAFRIAWYNTVSADVIHLERNTDDSLAVVARLILPPSIRMVAFDVYSVCTVGGRKDPEVFGLYPAKGATPEHPIFAWRVNRTALRFEPLQTGDISCRSEDDEVDATI